MTLARCALLLLAWFAHGTAAQPLPRTTPQAAYAEIARSGELHQRHIDGDLDASKLQAPAGAKRMVLREVHIGGRLHASASGPALALHIIDRSRLADIDLRETQWKAPLVIENSVIEQRAWFDGARFDAAFAHARFRDCRRW